MNEISTDNLGDIYQQPLAQQIMENAFLGFIGNLDAYMKAKVHVAQARTKHEKEQAEIARKNAEQRLRVSQHLLDERKLEEQVRQFNETQEAKAAIDAAKETASEKRTADAKSRVDSALEIDEKKRERDEAEATKEREREDTERNQRKEQIKKAYPNLDDAQVEAIVDDAIPVAEQNKVLEKARDLRELRERYPDKSEAEIREIHRQQNEPRTSREAHKAIKAIEAKQELESMLANGEIDQKTYEQGIARIDDEFESAERAKSTMQQRAAYARERFKDDPVRMQQELDKIYLESSSGSKDQSEIDQYLGYIRKYEKGSDNRELALMVSAMHEKAPDKLTALAELDFILEDTQNIGDIEAEQLDDISQYLSKVAISHATKGEVIKKLDAANRLIAKKLPELYEKFKHIKEQDLEIGRFMVLADQTVRFVQGKTAFDPEVAAFQNEVSQLIEEVLRLRTGAVINDEETAKAQRELPGVGVEYELNDVMFLSLATYTAGRQRLEYEFQLGENWGEQVANRDLKRNYAMIDELKPKIIGKTDKEKQTDYWEGVDKQ